MFEEIRLYLFIFFIYGIAGWLLETIIFSIENKKFVNRGFLVGPICPIYGYGVVLISLLLKKYQNDMVVTFFMSVIICGTLEYFTSFFMEKIFKARWWDYSKIKFNINGRICLQSLTLFGIASIIIVCITNPFIFRNINSIPALIQNILICILLLLHILDTITSFKIILNLKRVSAEITDNTIEISEKVKNIIHSKSLFHRRLVNAFPNIKDNVDYKNWTIVKKLKERKSKNN